MTPSRDQKETNLIEKQSFQLPLPWWLIETPVFSFLLPKGKNKHFKNDESPSVRRLELDLEKPDSKHLN